MANAARRPLMAGNWKMNLNHLEAISLTQKLAFSLNEKQLTDVEVVVLPPFTDLRGVQTLIDGDKLLLGYGAQDLSAHVSGAYTGEISGAMLAKLGCQYVVVGHSERRAYHNEDDALVNAKVKAALANELAPILCVGEPLDVREAGTHVEHTLAQLDAALDGLKSEQVEKVVVAYEPVWAIGTGRTATPENAQEVIGAIRARLTETFGAETAGIVRVLYGGSVKASNAADIMAQPDVDGALVGGAALIVDEFVGIVRFAG
ncbi:triosephosphate isomerase [Allocatelliglobosispora scoriae]|uniref:Triosephosphate isomerase n=1 Tax=Allocatelliglobosispora scoriae TaxID=643052 RepID=A0A841BJF8_9ACTN|nr:triose-phosphate isomerase [Allocatelliglobosispora scoriae]MBB5869247.1 triosephosphate isomerase [Allocatelliglobosispora scoriae]